MALGLEADNDLAAGGVLLRVVKQDIYDLPQGLGVARDPQTVCDLIAQAQAAAEDFCRAEFAENAPQPVRLAILLFVGFYYENRDVPDHQTYATMREAFENLLYPYRDPEKMF